MTLAESYQALSALLDYPQDKESMLKAVSGVACVLDRDGLPPAVTPFEDFVRNLTLGELQEKFVATFDFSPSRAPYLGHHLHGDNQKKAAYMIMLKEQYASHAFSPRSDELPDHLSVLLTFLAHLSRESEDDYRRELIGKAILPGMRKLVVGADRNPHPWRPVVEAAELLMSEDCKEVSP